MPHLEITTKQLLTIMRGLSTARQLSEHIADLTDAKADGEYQQVWESLMEKVEDFGLSLPQGQEEHWSQQLEEEVHDDLHTYVDAELDEAIAQDLAFGEHAATCTDASHENEQCRSDLLNRRDAWLAKLQEGPLYDALQKS